jgi:hypothetical protein
MNELKPTTIDQVEQVELYLETIRANGKSLDCISPAYLKMIDNVLKHMRVRMARGEWSKS